MNTAHINNNNNVYWTTASKVISFVEYESLMKIKKMLFELCQNVEESKTFDVYLEDVEELQDWFNRENKNKKEEVLKKLTKEERKILGV